MHERLYLNHGETPEQAATKFCEKRGLQSSVKMAIVDMLLEKLHLNKNFKSSRGTQGDISGHKGHLPTPLKTQEMLNTEFSLHHMPGLIYSGQLSSRDHMSEHFASGGQSLKNSDHPFRKSKHEKENMDASSRYGLHKQKHQNEMKNKIEINYTDHRQQPSIPALNIDTKEKLSPRIPNTVLETAVFPLKQPSPKSINQHQPSLKKPRKVFYVDQDLDLQELEVSSYIKSSQEYSGRGEEVIDLTPVKPHKPARVAHPKPNQYGQMLPSNLSKQSSTSMLLELAAENAVNYGTPDDGLEYRVKRSLLKESDLGTSQQLQDLSYRSKPKTHTEYNSQVNVSGRAGRVNDFHLFVNPHLEDLQQVHSGSKSPENYRSQDIGAHSQSSKILSQIFKQPTKAKVQTQQPSALSNREGNMSKSKLSSTNWRGSLSGVSPIQHKQASKSRISLSKGSSSFVRLSSIDKRNKHSGETSKHRTSQTRLRLYDSKPRPSKNKSRANSPHTRGFSVHRDREVDHEVGVQAGNRLYTQAVEKDLQQSAIRLQRQNLEEQYYNSLERIPKIDKVSKELAEARINSRFSDYRYQPQEVFDRLSKAAKQSFWKKELRMRARSLECSSRDRYVPETNPISAEIVQMHQERIGSETSRDPFLRLYTNNPEDFYQKHREPEDWEQARSMNFRPMPLTTERTSRSKDSKGFLERMAEDISKRIEAEKSKDAIRKTALAAQVKSEGIQRKKSTATLNNNNSSHSRISPSPVSKRTAGHPSEQSLYEKGLAQLSRREALIKEAASLSKSLSSKSLTSKRSQEIVERIVHEHVVGIFKTLDTDKDGFVSFANVLQEFETGHAPVTRRFSELIAPFMKQIVEKKMTLDSLAFEYSLKKFIKKLNVSDKRVLLCLDYEGKNAFMKMMARNAQDNLKREGLSHTDIKDYHNPEEIPQGGTPGQPRTSSDNQDNNHSPQKPIKVSHTAISINPSSPATSPSYNPPLVQTTTTNTAATQPLNPSKTVTTGGSLDDELAGFKQRMEALGMYGDATKGETSNVLERSVLDRSARSGETARSGSGRGGMPVRVGLGELKEIVAAATRGGTELGSRRAQVEVVGGLEIVREVVAVEDAKVDEAESDSLALEGTEGFAGSQGNGKSLDGLVREFCERSLAGDQSSN